MRGQYNGYNSNNNVIDKKKNLRKIPYAEFSNTHAQTLKILTKATKTITYARL